MLHPSYTELMDAVNSEKPSIGGDVYDIALDVDDEDIFEDEMKEDSDEDSEDEDDEEKESESDEDMSSEEDDYE